MPRTKRDKIIHATQLQVLAGKKPNIARAKREIKMLPEDVPVVIPKPLGKVTAADFVALLEQERNRELDEIRARDLSQVPYNELVRSFEIMAKHTELVAGRATERFSVNAIPEEFSAAYEAFKQSLLTNL